MAWVREVTREELLARRERILARLGMSYEEFLRRAEAYTLVGEEHDALDDLRDIEFLLGE